MTRGLDSNIKVEPPFYDSSVPPHFCFSFLLYCGCAGGIGHAPHANRPQLREVSITR